MSLSKASMMSLLMGAVLSNRLMRNLAANQFEKMLYRKIMIENDPKFSKPLYSEKARLERFYGLRAMFKSLLKNMDKGYISKKYAQRLIETLVGTAMMGDKKNIEAIKNYKEKYKMKPPTFFTLSPTKQCNLNCYGCYASSFAKSTEKLEFNIIKKIIKELHDELGMRFFVISGGEPLLYKSQGKTILDLPKKWKDSFFLMYTNGTLITEKVAKKMADLGNITPAISVEGFEKQTDKRRGSGVHKKVLNAMKNLRNNGVMFGVSVTATKENIDVLLKDKFYNYYFDKLGASYMWMFQYMPIGRKFSTELMINPEQRFQLFKQWRKMLRKNNYYVADFWNSAVLSSGCISCSREGGYFYIDWNGNIMPCVFIPYYQDNVKDLFAKNKKITDALFSELFVKGREWQSNYFENKKEGKTKVNNLLMPRLMRDHHKDFLKVVKSCKRKIIPEDEAAAQALKSKEYHKKLMIFDKKLEKLTKPLWEKEYE